MFNKIKKKISNCVIKFLSLIEKKQQQQHQKMRFNKDTHLNIFFWYLYVWFRRVCLSH